MTQVKCAILRDIACISPGYPLRGAVTAMAEGDVQVVQIKNVNIDSGVDWPGVAKVSLTGRRDPDWLRPGDILFAARGQRNVAVCIIQPPGKAVCSPHFFLIRVKEASRVQPDFLAWHMNLPETQRYFAQSATGSYITSIRKHVLEDTPLRIPAPARQSLLVKLAAAAGREKQLNLQLMENRRRAIEALADYSLR